MEIEAKKKEKEEKKKAKEAKKKEKEEEKVSYGVILRCGFLALLVL